MRRGIHDSGKIPDWRMVEGRDIANSQVNLALTNSHRSKRPTRDKNELIQASGRAMTTC